MIPGAVEFTGPISDIVLNIDPETGAGEIRVDSPLVGDFDITGITIASTSDSLNESSYEGFGGDWDVSPNNDDGTITELNLTGSELFSNGSAFSLGNLFDTCLLYTSPSPRDKRQSRMPSSA